MFNCLMFYALIKIKSLTCLPFTRSLVTGGNMSHFPLKPKKGRLTCKQTPGPQQASGDMEKRDKVLLEMLQYIFFALIASATDG